MIRGESIKTRVIVYHGDVNLYTDGKTEQRTILTDVFILINPCSYL